MLQQRLSYLAIVSIEHEILDSLDTRKLIQDFANIKARRGSILTIPTKAKVVIKIIFRMDLGYHDPKFAKDIVLNYKEFLLGLRNTELAIPYIVLNDNISPQLFEYVSNLNAVKFIDGSYHTYCGEIKKIINKLISFWTEQINDAVREADRITHSITKTELLRLINKSYQIHEQRQIDFANEFLPVRTPEEQKDFDKIVEKFERFMDKFRQIKEAADAIDKAQNVTQFARERYEISLHRRTALLEYTHSFISVDLAHHTYRIKCSMEECLLRVKNNLKKIEADRDVILNNLMMELYDKNKERLTESRKENRSSFEEADIEFSLNRLRDKIEDYQKSNPIPRLEDEVRYWEKRISEYEKIETVLKQLKRAKVTILEQEKWYNSVRCIEIIPSKIECWEHIGKNIQQRKVFIEEQLLHAAKALLTFFGVKGQNRIFYIDNIGRYNIDEYGHQIYFFDSGKKVCHVDCYGNYREVLENSKYYYDKNGRYVLSEPGQNVYQVAPCTSSYNLGNDDLLEKITVDCGHSDNIRPDCRMQLKDPNDREMLPSIENVDIRETLKPETVQYLWKNVGHVLPEPLRDVEKLRSKNPIQDLAHSIVFHRYRRTTEEITEIEQEAGKFRENVLQGRKDKMIAESKAWKEKQTKRRKPAESDDLFERAVYNANIERLSYIRSLNFFNDN